MVRRSRSCAAKNPIVNEQGQSEESWGQALITVLKQLRSRGSPEPEVALSAEAPPQSSTLGTAPPQLPERPTSMTWGEWQRRHTAGVRSFLRFPELQAGSSPYALAVRFSISLVIPKARPSAGARLLRLRKGGSHAVTRRGRFRCAARAAGTDLPGDSRLLLLLLLLLPLLLPVPLPRSQCRGDARVSAVFLGLPGA